MSNFASVSFKPVYKYGKNADIDTVLSEDVCDVVDAVTGLQFYASAQAATTIESDSADDTAEGTGAQTVKVWGVGDAGTEVIETVTMDGTSQATLTNQFKDIYRMRVVDVGSGGTNAGNIQAKHGTDVLAQITAGEGSTLMAVYTVPTDYYCALCTNFWVGMEKSNAGNTDAKLFVRAPGKAWIDQQPLMVAKERGTLFREFSDPGLWIAAGHQIRVHAGVSANNTPVIAGFDLRMYKYDDWRRVSLYD